MKSLFFLTALLLSSSAFAGTAPGFGYVDMQRVIEESQRGQRAQRALEERFSEPQRKLAQEEQAIRKLQKETERDAALMSRETLEKRKRTIRERIERLQRDAAQAQRELAQEQMKLGAEIVLPAKKIIRTLAEKKGLKAVFERNQSGFLYIDEGIDLTPEVIRRLDQQTP